MIASISAGDHTKPCNMLDLFTNSFFAGDGGMSKGAKLAGFRSLYQSDIWEVPKKVFDANKNRPDLSVDNYCRSEGVYQAGQGGDMYNITLESINAFLQEHGYPLLKIGDVPLMTSGSPCQDMSRVNPKRHPSETRNLLMIQQLRTVKKLLPLVVVIEQVDSFFDKPMMPFKESFLRALKQLENEYHWHYGVLNAMDYGARQNRKRVIFLLVRKDLGTLPSFPQPMPIQPSQFVCNLLPDIAAFSVKENFQPANQVFGTMTSSPIQVLTTKGERRIMTIQERQVLCNLEDLDLNVPGVTNTDKCTMLGNMVQIPFMAELCKHIRKEILKA